jgi:hypothetical protein
MWKPKFRKDWNHASWLPCGKRGNYRQPRPVEQLGRINFRRDLVEGSSVNGRALSTYVLDFLFVVWRGCGRDESVRRLSRRAPPDPLSRLNLALRDKKAEKRGTVILDFINAARTRDFADPTCGSKLGNLEVEGVTLGGLIELACSGAAWSSRDDPSWRSWFSDLCGASPYLKRAERALARALRGEALIALAADVEVEIHGFSSKSDLDNDWNTVQENFVRRLQVCGFPKTFAYALNAALDEMVQNVWDHSGAPGGPMAAGLVAYYVLPEEAHFAVGDVGRGALASLRENPRWLQLSHSTAALEAILKDNATRKASEATGGGFRQVWKSFLDRGGMVLLSSGDGYARGFNDGTRTLESGFLSDAPGFRFCASCALNRMPDEKILK